MNRIRLWMHTKYGVHHWSPLNTGGNVDKRRCRICGLIEWFDYIEQEWSLPTTVQFKNNEDRACRNCGDWIKPSWSFCPRCAEPTPWMPTPPADL